MTDGENTVHKDIINTLIAFGTNLADTIKGVHVMYWTAECPRFLKLLV